ncbi:ketoacyl-synthetase C-terminal extension domain-containing protein, partial [Nonomuraea sp. NPDC048916]|uniref:CurL C-terminal domain-containing protein n=1 Tax=Nonomuraea sp. NPDC048916 TaxID=3154232 RepID=UPI003406CC7E
MTEAVEWRREGRPRRAGVSSFGLSGTNAHVILEEGESEPTSEASLGPVPVPVPVPEPEPEVAASLVSETGPAASLVPVVVSAAREGDLPVQAARLRAWLADRPGVGLQEAAFSLATRRTTFPHRAAILATDRDAAVRGLGALAQGEASHDLLTGTSAGALGFVFSGQGGQWVGMGRGLYERFGVFAGALDEVVGGFGGVVGGGLREVM